MRTSHDDLVSEIKTTIYHELNDGTMSEEEMTSTLDHMCTRIMSSCWKYVEEHRIDYDNRLIFEYGMLKHLFKGAEEERKNVRKTELNQKEVWLEARKAWEDGNFEKAKELEHDIFLYMNPWSYVKGIGEIEEIGDSD